MRLPSGVGGPPTYTAAGASIRTLCEGAQPNVSNGSGGGSFEFIASDRENRLRQALASQT